MGMGYWSPEATKEYRKEVRQLATALKRLGGAVMAAGGVMMTPIVSAPEGATVVGVGGGIYLAGEGMESAADFAEWFNPL